MLSRAKILACISEQYEPHKFDIVVADNLGSLYFDHSVIHTSFYNIFQWRWREEPISNVGAANTDLRFILGEINIFK